MGGYWSYKLRLGIWMVICHQFFIPIPGVAQNIDSLIAVTRSPVSESRIGALNDLAWVLRYDDVERATLFAQQARVEALVAHDSSGLATSHARLGVCFKNEGLYFKSIEHYIKSRKLRLALRDSMSAYGLSSGIAVSFQKAGKMDSALHYAYEALYRIEENSLAFANILATVGAIYEDVDSLHLAAKYLGNALLIYEYLENKPGESRALSSLGGVYQRFGKLDSALFYFEQSLKLKRSLHDSIGIANTLHNIGMSVWHFGQIESAERSLLEALRIDSSLQNNYGMVRTYYTLGDMNLSVGRQELAVSYLKKAADYDTELNITNLTSDIYERLSEAYEQQGDFRLALSSHLKATQASERMIEFNNEEVILEAEKKYDTYRVNQLNAQLKDSNSKLNMYVYSAVAAICILVFLVVLLVLYQRQSAVISNKNEQIKQKEIDELLQKQELASLDAMLEGQEKERKRIAEDLHDRIGSQLAAVKLNMEALEGKVEDGQAQNQAQFSRTYGMLDDLVDEVRKLSHDMVSGVLMKFGLEEAVRELAGRISASGKMGVEVRVHNLDERVSGKVEIAVYRMVQELLANVLKHARASEISISLTRQNGNLNVLVEDNGVGFDPKRIKKGMGLDNVNKRAATLNGSAIIDSKTGRGTTVILDIPLP